MVINEATSKMPNKAEENVDSSLEYHDNNRFMLW